MSAHSTQMPSQQAHGGRIVWSWKKIAWFLVTTVPALCLAVPYFSWSGLLIFTISSAMILCVGHSVGLHRGLIHQSYKTHAWLRYILVTLGMTAGMGSLFAMLRMHEYRDYWQNQPEGPDYFAYDHNMWTDFKWYVLMAYEPGEGEYQPEVFPSLMADRYYQFLDRTWVLQQVVIGALLFALGGMPWLVWGGFVRVSVAIFGHWFVNYEAHTHGYQNYDIDGARVQGRNAWLWGAVSMGEGWHNNHHAWPSSARMGLRWWELDMGYAFIWVMEKLGLFWDVKVAHDCPSNPNGLIEDEQFHDMASTVR